VSGDTPAHCPCREPASAPSYAQCCGRYLEGSEPGAAPNAEQLMRSRYSAFVLGRWDYLLQTWHASTRPTVLAPTEPGLRWLGLELRGHTVLDADHAIVEFAARSKLGGRAQRLHEVSRFVREAGRWYYVAGD